MRERKRYKLTQDVLLQDVDVKGVSMPQDTYQAGQVYELDKEVGEGLKKSGKAESAGRGRPSKDDAEKMKKEGAPENKQDDDEKQKKGWF
jgi:hypothetical protein